MKYSLFFKTGIFVLFFCVSVLYAQDNQIEQNPQITENTQVDVQTAPIDEATLPIQGAVPTVPETSTASTIWLFVRMILVLALVIACIYAFVWFMRKSFNKNNNAQDQFLRVVSSVSLSPGKSVQVVSLINDKAYIIGVTDNAINLIGEITDKETINAMNLYADKTQNVKKPKNFNEILSIFMPNAPKSKENIFQGDADKTRDILREQHNRLDSGK